MIQDVLHLGRKVHRCQCRLAKKPFTYFQKLEEAWVRSSTPKPHMRFVCSSIVTGVGGGGGLRLLAQHLVEQDKAKQPVAVKSGLRVRSVTKGASAPSGVQAK